MNRTCDEMILQCVLFSVIFGWQPQPGIWASHVLHLSTLQTGSSKLQCLYHQVLRTDARYVMQTWLHQRKFNQQSSHLHVLLWYGISLPWKCKPLLFRIRPFVRQELEKYVINQQLIQTSYLKCSHACISLSKPVRDGSLRLFVSQCYLQVFQLVENDLMLHHVLTHTVGWFPSCCAEANMRGLQFSRSGGQQ